MPWRSSTTRHALQDHVLKLDVRVYLCSYVPVQADFGPRETTSNLGDDCALNERAATVLSQETCSLKDYEHLRHC